MADLEFAVEYAESGKNDPVERVFEDFAKACAHAVAMAGSTGREVHVDVLAWTEDAAKSWMGDEGVEVYREDPDASVFDRIVIKAESQGRVA